MAVSSTGVPLFAGVENIDDMFITTMDELDKEVGEQISIPHPTWRYLKDNNLVEMRDEIGNYVPVRLLDKANSTVKDFTAYDDVDNTPQDALSEAKFAYGHMVGTQMYNREELVKNQGKSQLIDLVETKQEQLNISLANNFGNNLMGTQDSDGRKFMGLGRIMAYDQSCGGLNPTTPGFGYWNPQRMLKSGGGSYALATEFRDGIRRLNLLCSYKWGAPSVHIVGADVYDAYMAWAESKLQLRIDDIKQQRGWGDFNMFPVQGTTIIYDEKMGAKDIWALNFKKAVKVRIHSGTNFQFEPWQMMENKVAKKRNCLVYASVYCRHRNANGYGTFT